MFTGLIREVGRVDAVAQRDDITRLELSAPRTARGLSVGDSLAVNGICLTVTSRSGHRVRVEATAETRRVTTLSGWKAGDAVHLEPSLRVGDQLGGHFVLGHVDGVGRVAALRRVGGAALLQVVVHPELAAQLLPKGSIAVDGVSLTLDEGPFADRFAITLVPHTLDATRFASMSAGDLVNVELDVLAKAAAAAVRGLGQAPRSGPPEAAAASAAVRATGLSIADLRRRGWERA